MPVVNPAPSGGTSGVSPFAFLVQTFAWMSKNWLGVGLLMALGFGFFVFWKFYLKKNEEEDIFLKDYNRTKDMCKLQMNNRRIQTSPVPIYIFGLFLFLGIGMLLVGVIMDNGDFIVWAFGVFGLGLLISIILHSLGIFKRRDRVYLISGNGSKFIGFYGGECVTEDMKNYLVVKGIGPAKKEFVIRVSLVKEIEMTSPAEKENGKKKKLGKISLPDNPVIEGEDSILIKGIGLQQYRYFLYPVLLDDKGNPISMKFIATSTEKDIALVDTLYSQTADFTRIMREQVNMNPSVRYKQKTQGETSAVE